MRRILGNHNYKRSHTFILVQEENIISHIQLFKKKIYCHGRQLPIIGMGFICTIPEFRNQGYCTKLLKGVIKNIEHNDAPLIILFTRIPKFYERFGFRRTIRKYCWIGKEDKKSSKLNLKNRGIKLRQFNFCKDIFSVMEIYKKFFSRRFGAIIREFGDWQIQQSHFNEVKRLFLVLEYQGKIKTYIRCKKSKVGLIDIIDIIEFASEDDDNYPIIYFIDYLFKHNRVDYVRINRELINKNLSSFFKIKWVNNSLLMYRFVKKDKILSGINMKKIVFLESDAF